MPNQGMINPLIDPTLYAQQLMLQQQQAIAQNSMEQGMTPMNYNQQAGGINGGYTIPISGMGALAHMGQTLAGALMQKDILQRQAGLNTSYAQQLARILGGEQPGQVSSSDPSSGMTGAVVNQAIQNPDAGTPTQPLPLQPNPQAPQSAFP